MGVALETAYARTCDRPARPLPTDRPLNSCYPSPAYLFAAPEGGSCGGKNSSSTSSMQSGSVPRMALPTTALADKTHEPGDEQVS